MLDLPFAIGKRWLLGCLLMGSLSLGCLVVGVLSAACSEEGGKADVGVAQGAITGAGGIEAVLVVSSSWRGGYCANVVVANRGTQAADRWAAELDLAGGAISSLRGATLAGSGDVQTARPISETARLEPGHTATFGFCANSDSRGRAQLRSVSAWFQETVTPKASPQRSAQLSWHRRG